MKKTVEILLLDTEEEYKEEYSRVYVNGGPFSLWDIPVTFDSKSFGHIFFEYAPGGIKKGAFSKRRAKQMYFMKALLDGGLNTEIMFETDSGNIAIFCKDLDCVMYLRHRGGSGQLQIGSFFDFGKKHTAMYEKQKRKCVSVVDTHDLKSKLKIGGC